MNIAITCLVTEDYRVAIDGVDDKDLCLMYGFDPETRRLLRIVRDPVAPLFMVELRHDAVAHNFFDQLVGTHDKLMEFAKTGQLSKSTLTALLKQENRQEFLRACAIIEKEATERCGAENPCLEDGCAFDGTDEVCLNAVLLSEGKCLSSCVNVWIEKFKYPENRIEVWKK